jgi:NAD(P)-dependent dehydrogenase (short-subunit alcohol dehydrogenase family)
VSGKVVLVTGGSSGIGLAAACKFAEAGAITLICARDEDKLAEARKEILAYAKGRGRADAVVETYAGRHFRRRPTQAFIAWLNETHGGVDFLINNAGRSIRRAIEAATTASTTSSARCS